MYVRKTIDEWNLYGNYGHGDGWEVLTAATSRKEILSFKRDYQENEPGLSLKIKCERVPIEAAA